jgi:hypothetical protein
MSDTTLRLMDQKVLSHTDNCLAPHMPVEAEGYACMTDNLLKVLLGVAATRARLNRCDVRTGDASALRAAIAMLAKRGDGRSHPPCLPFTSRSP